MRSRQVIPIDETIGKYRFVGQLVIGTNTKALERAERFIDAYLLEHLPEILARQPEESEDVPA